jgi:hypothetical protein
MFGLRLDWGLKFYRPYREKPVFTLSFEPQKIVFAKIGWHTNIRPTGWKSNNAKQAEFVTTFFNLTKTRIEE